MHHACDLCGADEPIPIEVARHYVGDQEPPSICSGCGFVYIVNRRPAREIAASWSELFDGTYSPRSPAVIARLTYVAETIRQQIGLEGKSVCDIGCGDGAFLEIARLMGGKPWGIEPADVGGQIAHGIPNFRGTIEDCEWEREFDIVTINWTLENTQSCTAMLNAARRLTNPDGYIVVATGSRLLVPYKKPLNRYLGTNPADTHCFRFSANSLVNALRRSGFEIHYLNAYADSDVLLVIGKPSECVYPFRFPDKAQAVARFFENWHKEWSS